MPSSNEIIPQRLFDLTRIDLLSISGRGGRERELGGLLFPSASRASSSLYDYEISDGSIFYRVEIKKQQNDQWFDIGKYFQLSDRDRDTVVVFVNHREGAIDTVAAIHLGVLVDFLLSHSEYKRYGWTLDVLRTACNLKKIDQCPELQFKAKLKVRNLIDEHRELFQIIYERVPEQS